jgi:hypothetical protein
MKRLLLVLAFASFARADSLQLLAPANGATLRGGSYAELRWSAARLPAGDEEWEAFLSIDGGTYYGFRITPHLDLERRRFTFLVPNLDTKNARILIRTGDEERESEFESASSFSIVRDADAEAVAPPLVEHEPGEAAREGDPAVLAWADGARNGSGITQHSSPCPLPPSLHKHTTTIASEKWPAVAPPLNRIEAPSIARTRPSARVRVARKAESIPLSVDLLLICRRRNV